MILSEGVAAETMETRNSSEKVPPDDLGNIKTAPMKGKRLVGVLSIPILCLLALWLGFGKSISGESLYGATLSGDGALVRRLIRTGAPLDYRFDGGNTPLMAASEISNPDIAAYLFAAGARPNLVGRQGTALDMASSHRMKQLLRKYGVKRSSELTSEERLFDLQDGEW